MKRTILLALAIAPLAATSALAAPAHVFLKKAAEGDQSEVTLGNFAAQRGASPGVRDYGRRLASDHGSHLTQVQGLAGRLHVRLPGGMTPDARAAYRRLQGLHGRAFDRAFTQHMVMDHKKDIAAYEAQVHSGDRDTADLARATLPTLREHLHIAQSLNH